MSIPQPVLQTPEPPAPDRIRSVTIRPETLDPEKILARHARTSFNLATRFLPEEQRRATTVLYAFFRILDDAVDEISRPSERKAAREQLDRWKAWSSKSDANPPHPELAEAVETILEAHEVPRHLIGEFIEGLISDLEYREIKDRADLDRYCHCVASTVGIVMSHVLGTRQPAALDAAARLGAAMQMTNILRDVGEDLEMNRVYLPTTTLQQHGLDRDELVRLMGDHERAKRVLAPMMQEEIRRTRQMYREALPGVWLLPRESRMSILLAGRLYRHLLSIIEANGYDSINHRAATSKWDKLREFSTCAILTRLWKYDDGGRLRGA